jgi:hypothetical protein
MGDHVLRASAIVWVMHSRHYGGFGSLRVFDFRWLMTIILVKRAAIHIYDQLCARDVQTFGLDRA